MTVTTILWATNGVGDAPLAPAGYTDRETQALFEQITMVDNTVQGVVRLAGNELEATSPGVYTIDVDTGYAIIRGVHLTNDAVESLSLPAVAADTAGLVYAEIDYAAQVGAISFTQQVSGNTTVPSLVQTGPTAGVWQIPIGSYVVDAGGDVWTDTTKTVAGVKDLRWFVGNHMDIEFRQGNSSTDWSNPGVANYRPAKFFVQVGAIEVTLSTANKGTATITFPRSFKTGTGPLVLLTANENGLDGIVANVVTLSWDTVEVAVYDPGGNGPGLDLDVYWMAIGARP